MRPLDFSPAHAIIRYKGCNHRDLYGVRTTLSVKVSVAVNACFDVPVWIKVIGYGMTVQLIADVNIRYGYFATHLTI